MGPGYLRPPFQPCVRFYRTRLTDGLLAQHAHLLHSIRWRGPCRAVAPIRSLGSTRATPHEATLGEHEERTEGFSCFSIGLLGLAAMPSRLPPAVRVTKAELLPSDGVMTAVVTGTMSPSDSLPARTRFAFGLSGPLRRTSAAGEGLSCSVSGWRCVPPSLPRGRPASLRLGFRCSRSPSPRRERLGHPPFRAFISRGCKVHASALRPTALLPCQQPDGCRRAFDTPLSKGILGPRPGSATRRAGAYRGGTPTRKSDTAWNPPGEPCSNRAGSVRTHHGSDSKSVAAPTAPPSRYTPGRPGRRGRT